MPVSRREVVSAAIWGCCASVAAPSRSEILPTKFDTLIGDDYQPTDVDERGLWHACDRLERDLAESDLVLKEPNFRTYLSSIFEKLIGRPTDDFRIYIVRDPTFNASMAPNGLMLVHTGLLARVQNEAQLASVLGHEAGHYYCTHTLERWRSNRRKSAVAAFIGAGANAAAGYSAMQGYDGQSWIDLANAINYGIVLSMFSFSREQESEADAYGISLLARAGYTPNAAAAVWQQLIDEKQASAAARDKKFKDRTVSAFSTHPPNAERLRDLTDTALVLDQDVVTSRTVDGREQWREAITPLLSSLLEEQVKLNDPGASLYLINRHAQSGWTGTLHYYQGEIYRLRGWPDDDNLAANAYAASVMLNDAPPEAWRAHGYALIKQNRRDEGRAALSRYLELKPQAPDAGIVRFSISQ